MKHFETRRNVVNSNSQQPEMLRWHSRDTELLVTECPANIKVLRSVAPYPLSETPDAIRYLEGGHARGKVVIQVDTSN